MKFCVLLNSYEGLEINFFFLACTVRLLRRNSSWKSLSRSVSTPEIYCSIYTFCKTSMLRLPAYLLHSNWAQIASCHYSALSFGTNLIKPCIVTNSFRGGCCPDMVSKYLSWLSFFLPLTKNKLSMNCLNSDPSSARTALNCFTRLVNNAGVKVLRALMVYCCWIQSKCDQPIIVAVSFHIL